MKILNSIINSIITNGEKYYKEIKDNIDTSTSLLFYPAVVWLQVQYGS